MTLDEQITILEHNSEYERTQGNLQGCLDFRHLVEWLKDYKCLLSSKKVEKWIPVTENTPSIGEIVLWCNKEGRVFSSAITHRNKYYSYVGKHGYFGSGLEQKGNILAWQPLPTSYKMEGEE